MKSSGPISLSFRFMKDILGIMEVPLSWCLLTLLLLLAFCHSGCYTFDAKNPWHVERRFKTCLSDVNCKAQAMCFVAIVREANNDWTMCKIKYRPNVGMPFGHAYVDCGKDGIYLDE